MVRLRRIIKEGNEMAEDVYFHAGCILIAIRGF